MPHGEHIAKSIYYVPPEVFKRYREYYNKLHNSLDYTKINLGLSPVDEKLIDSFISILYAEGKHAFLSEKRYFIFTKNMGIEISYFLLSRLKGFLENNP